jgi:hypothetical protein
MEVESAASPLVPPVGILEVCKLAFEACLAICLRDVVLAGVLPGIVVDRIGGKTTTAERDTARIVKNALLHGIGNNKSIGGHDTPKRLCKRRTQ